MAFHNWFLPHRDTHKKAHLISWEALLIYVLIFILLKVGFSIFSYTNPGILGITANIDQKKLIELTNQEREKKGLPSVLENEALGNAARLKAENMFEEDYWAHFAPSGKTPWDFILGSGYRFTLAGENLAKNFYTAEEVVAAWMASPTHKDNLLNPRYKDIGIAVTEGVLNGQKTTLIVQEFATNEVFSNNPVVEVSGKQIVLPPEQINNKPDLVASVTKSTIKPAILDPYLVTKWGGLTIIGFIMVLLTLDILILKRRGVFRISSHHWPHMALLSLAAGSLFLSSPGTIL